MIRATFLAACATLSLGLSYAKADLVPIYNYQFETAAANFDSVSGSNQGSQTGGTSDTAGGAVGNYVDFAGGTTVGLVTLGNQGTALFGLDAQDFKITFDINGQAGGISGNNSFDHPLYFSFNDSNNNSFHLNTLGGGDTSGNVAFNSTTGGGFGGGSQIGGLLDGTWQEVSIVGTASGNKTQFEIFLDGVSKFTKTTIDDTIGSSLDVISFGGNAGQANRSFDGGIDEFTVFGVPEPSSAALFGLGGLALILRRRK